MDELFSLFSLTDTWISLLTLTLMEIVLGVDNVIFISILSGKLPKDEQARARSLGLTVAVGTRIALLFGISWLASLSTPFFTVGEFGLTGRDLILLVGGIFLITKATLEIHHKLEGVDGEKSAVVSPSFNAVVIQIMFLDIVFSLDSVITAVGLVKHVSIMIIAILLSLGVMLVAAKSISDFVEKHPTIKILALSFLLMIGTILVAEGCHFHVPKGYVYFAMAFSVGVEMLNLKMRAKHVPLKLKREY